MEKNEDFIRKSDYLVVTRAGRNSLHREWISPLKEEMNFDILVAAYEPQTPDIEHENVFNKFVPGRKVEGYSRILRELGEFIFQYRAIAFIDDDISSNAANISKCFEIGNQLGLAIWQPALSLKSHFTYAGLLANSGCNWRHVNFIEMMCPFFSLQKLREIEFLFHLGYESGIDLVWCNVGHPGPKDFAVLDCCPVTHTKPVGLEKERNGFSGTRRYEDDIEQVLRKFEISWLSCVPYSCVKRDGTSIVSRMRMLLLALRLLVVVPQNSHMRLRGRAVLVHWKHLLTRPARNYRLSHTV